MLILKHCNMDKYQRGLGDVAKAVAEGLPEPTMLQLTCSFSKAKRFIDLLNFVTKDGEQRTISCRLYTLSKHKHWLLVARKGEALKAVAEYIESKESAQ